MFCQEKCSIMLAMAIAIAITFYGLLGYFIVL